MSTPESVAAQIQKLIDKANAKTGRTDTDLTTAVNALIAGYGASSDGEQECAHGSTTVKYIGAGEGTHTVKTVCAACGVAISEATEACADENEDGKCDLCGSAVASGGEGTCNHESTTKEYSYYGNGHHIVKENCATCGEQVAVSNFACTPGAAVITANNDGTHISITKCTLCGGTITETTEACTDADSDGLCDVCGGAVALGGYAGEDYSGTLNYLHECAFVVSDDGVLVIGARTAYPGYEVAVSQNANGISSAMVSGKNLTPIAVPAEASKITISLENDRAETVTVLAFAGTKASVTSHEEFALTPDENNQCIVSFAAGAYDYFCMTLKGDYESSSSDAPYATGMSIRFE